MRNILYSMQAVEAMPVSLPLSTRAAPASRWRWFVRITMCAALGAGIGWLIGNQVQADAQYGRAHTALSEARQQKATVLSELAAVKDHETIDTGFEMFIEKVAATGELDRLQDKIRRTFGALTGLEMSTNARIRRRLAEALA